MLSLSFLMNAFAICTLAVCVLLMPGCIFSADSSLVDIVVIAPDKAVYHSNDPMTLNVTLKVSEDIEDVTINATGIENNVGQILLKKSMDITLHEGINNVTFFYRLPSCSSCQKLNPGVYPIEVAVSHNGDTLAKETKEIEIKQ
jgi:hypothetical protein